MKKDPKQLIADMSWLIINQVAPEELPLFDELIELYFENPNPPEMRQAFPHMSSEAGVDDFLAAVTPAVAAVVEKGLSELIQISLDYQRGLKKLEYHIPVNHNKFPYLHSYKVRLAENLDSKKRYGDTNEKKADRFEILDGLNNLTLETIGSSFYELSEPEEKMPAKIQEAIISEWQTLAVRYHLTEEEAEKVANLLISTFITVVLSL